MTNSKENEEKIKWFKTNFMGSYDVSIDDKGYINVKGSCILINDKLTELPYKIGSVTGDFWLNAYTYSNPYKPTDKLCLNIDFNINTLKNCPDYVQGTFNCSGCPNLKNLKGGPSKVDGNYKCNHCGLESFEGIASEIGGNIIAYANYHLTDISALNNISYDWIDLDFSPKTLYESSDYKNLSLSGKLNNPPVYSYIIQN
jgi:hypothetical protein